MGSTLSPAARTQKIRRPRLMSAFIEVKGRSHHGEIALTSNEYRTAQRLAKDYYLYVVLHCATPKPSLNILQDPSKLDWQPVVKVEHYKLRVDSPTHPIILREDPPPFHF